MFLFHTIDLKFGICMLNDPRTIKRCYNNKKNWQIQEVSIVSTRDTVPGGHFDQNINGITKQNILINY